MGAILLCSLTANVLLPQARAQILTGRADNSRSGTNSNETYLTPANVNSAQFGKLFAYSVDGYVVSQPLYVPQVIIQGQAHNVVYVATQHDSVYAFDADTFGTGAPLWSKSFINPAQGVTTVPIADQGCATVTAYTEIGIMGTPTIDASTGTLYVDAKTKEVVNGVPSYYHRLHALDITSGAEKFNGPAVISASVLGTSGEVVFSALPQQQRPGLLLSNETVYLGFGSNGCDANAQGWVLAYDASDLQDQVGVFNSAPGEPWGGSVWQAGVGLAGDANGNVFFSTANGVFDENIGGSDFGDSVIKLSLGTNGLSVADYFTPFDQLNMGEHDLDLGSGGDLLLPDQPPPSPAHLLVTIGKTGSIYVIDRDNMGKFDASGNDIVQTIPNATIQYFGGPNFWNNLVYFAPSGETPITAYQLKGGQLLTNPLQSPAIFVDGLPFISANGSTNGVFWIVRNISGNILAAYDASTLMLIYISTQNSGRDALGSTVHFASPMVANGKLYAGTQTQLAVYGLLPVVNIVAGNNQTGTVGSVLPSVLQVQVTDPYSGQPISGFALNFISNAGGSFTNPNPKTNAQGMASTKFMLPTTSGSITINASNTISTVATFMERAVAGTAAAIVPASGQNQTGVVGTKLAAPLVFKVQDKFGNGVTGQQVTLTDNSAGGHFSNNPATTDSRGNASTSYQLPTKAGFITVTATSGTLTPATMQERAISGSPKIVSVVSGNNQTAHKNSKLPLPLVVAVKDLFGNPNANVVVTFSDGGAGGTFSTSKPVTAANGQASVTYTTSPQVWLSDDYSESGRRHPSCVHRNRSVALFCPIAAEFCRDEPGKERNARTLRSSCAPAGGDAHSKSGQYQRSHVPASEAFAPYIWKP
jgi:hypothetical protein